MNKCTRIRKITFYCKQVTASLNVSRASRTGSGVKGKRSATAEVSVSVCFLRCVVCDCEFIALTVMSVLYMDKLSRVYERYQEYVRTNPAAASHLESTVRALSYLIAGETLNVCQSESKHTPSRLVKQCRARLKLDVCLFSYCSLSAVISIVLLPSVFGSLFFLYFQKH